MRTRSDAPAVAETSAQTVLADVAGDVRQRQVAHVDAAVAGVRVELGTEAVRHLERHRAVAGDDVPVGAGRAARVGADSHAAVAGVNANAAQLAVET